LHSAFGGRPATTITTVCTSRTRTLDAAHRALVAAAVARGWAAKNLMATSGKAVGMAIFFVGFLAALANFAGFPRSFPLFFLCFGVSFVGVLVSALSAHARPVRRTRAGDAVLAELAPYRAALTGTGLERIPPDRAAEVFSRSLPYAVALGMASAWTRRFADLFASAPQSAASWYRPAGKGTMALGAVTADVAGFVTAAGVRPAASSSGSSWSSWSFDSSGSSSSDSSFSGGGDSGGGSSGGGGSW